MFSGLDCRNSYAASSQYRGSLFLNTRPSVTNAIGKPPHSLTTSLAELLISVTDIVTRRNAYLGQVQSLPYIIKYYKFPAFLLQPFCQPQGSQVLGFLHQL